MSGSETCQLKREPKRRQITSTLALPILTKAERKWSSKRQE